jgi:hypothetical protein
MFLNPLILVDSGAMRSAVALTTADFSEKTGTAC